MKKQINRIFSLTEDQKGALINKVIVFERRMEAVSSVAEGPEILSVFTVAVQEIFGNYEGVDDEDEEQAVLEPQEDEEGQEGESGETDERTPDSGSKPADAALAKSDSDAA